MFPGRGAGRMAEPWRPGGKIVSTMLGYKSFETTPTTNFAFRETAKCQAKGMPLKTAALLPSSMAR
jgi:hypothetical protein